MRIVFVCYGNICRSPMAEAVFSHLVKEAGVDVAVDSCGTHAATRNRAHRGTLRVLEEHGIAYDGISRPVEESDMEADLIICMDTQNKRDLEERYGANERIHLLLEYADTDETDVPDPYYTGGFEHVYELIESGCRGLLAQIREGER
ncbi:MAG: low molecular weight protein-tyrosine-phosphatase [Candidatus Woesearchaeota archaeon]